MDPTVTVAFIAFLGTVVTVMGGIVGIIVTNRKEKGQVADHSIDATLEQRLLLRDDIIDNLTAQLGLSKAREEQLALALREFREDVDKEEKEDD